MKKIFSFITLLAAFLFSQVDVAVAGGGGGGVSKSRALTPAQIEECAKDPSKMEKYRGRNAQHKASAAARILDKVLSDPNIPDENVDIVIKNLGPRSENASNWGVDFSRLGQAMFGSPNKDAVLAKIDAVLGTASGDVFASYSGATRPGGAGTNNQNQQQQQQQQQNNNPPPVGERYAGQSLP